MLVACNQYPEDTDLCVSQASSPSSSFTTTKTTTSSSAILTNRILPAATISNVSLCFMCQSSVSVSDLLNDYCRSSVVVRTRPIKISSISDDSFIFANKNKVRYFKRLENYQLKFDVPIKKCPCIKLNSPTILFLSSDGEIIRFISVKRNPRVFQRFRNTIVLRKPRCQHRL